MFSSEQPFNPDRAYEKYRASLESDLQVYRKYGNENFVVKDVKTSQKIC